MNKALKIFTNAVPILIMIGLIPLVEYDVILSFVYLFVIFVSLKIKREKGDLGLFVFGLLIMTLFEFIFVKTGAETFNRNSLLGVMPMWLPILWGYGFIAVRRGIDISIKK
jgi:hypothetical protein